MKPGFPPPLPPDDEATDPLLAGLRQRLGDYGQAPPPGAWAAIRQQVPPPPPPPWWRRRHLLAVLGLVLSCLLAGKLSEWTGLRQAGKLAATANHSFENRASSRAPLTNTLGRRVARRPKSSPASEAAAPSGLANRTPIMAPAPAADAPAPQPRGASATSIAPADRATAGRVAPQRWSIAASGEEAGRSGSVRPPAAATPRKGRSDNDDMRQPDLAALLATRHPGRQPLSAADAAGESRRAWAARPRRALSAGPGVLSALAGPGRAEARLAARQRTRSLASRPRRPRVIEAVISRQPASPGTISGPATKSSTRGRLVDQQRAREARQVPKNSLHATALSDSSTSETAVAAGEQAAFLPGLLHPTGPLDLLAPKVPGPLAGPAVPLATLVARPDSAPTAPPVRRWALLVLAGPTISYRTLGPPPTLVAGRPDFARLERPALGLGAQVQVRRVLSGRWALAVGLGYHEYATRLALSVKDSSFYNTFHQRDTYRLLTVPVQASYALGVPKSRLSKALVLGAEPGWYLAGRSTEGSGCGCEQQTYTSAVGSPYRSLTVAFSLGLDLRYRLGGAGARWQWLVQPTGRYVATPFVRRDAAGFTQRQPFSLGLLTGFSWDVR